MVVWGVESERHVGNVVLRFIVVANAPPFLIFFSLNFFSFLRRYGDTR